jgi:hypothetical protein
MDDATCESVKRVWEQMRTPEASRLWGGTELLRGLLAARPRPKVLRDRMIRLDIGELGWLAA